MADSHSLTVTKDDGREVTAMGTMPYVIDALSRYQQKIGERGPFTLIPTDEALHLGQHRYEIRDAKNKFVCSGMRSTLTKLMPILETSYAEWLMVKP